MPTAKLTDKLVAQTALPPGQADLVVWDTDVTGFALRVRPGGKTWFVGYRPAGAGRAANMRRMKLGSVKIIDRAADARKMAREILGKVALGIDPLKEREALKVRAMGRVADVLDRYRLSLVRREYVDLNNTMNDLTARLSPFKNRNIQTLSDVDLITIIDRLNEAGKPGAARAFRRHVNAFLNWCLNEAKVISANPLAGYRKQRVTRAEKVAKEEYGRALNDDEIAALWEAAGDEQVFGRLIRFLILSGCRAGEGSGLEYAMISSEMHRIDLPALFVKQGRAHVVYLTPAVVDLLRKCPRDARSDLVFPAWRTGQEMSGFSKMMPPLRKRSGVDFKMHDLRRTFRTGLSRIGVEEGIAELAIGHAQPHLIAIYDRHKQEEKVREAFERWSSHIEKHARQAPDVFA